MYVILPISMHGEYTIWEDLVGKYVICEKHLALDLAECKEIIAACKEAGVMLSVYYRLYFEQGKD